MRDAIKNRISRRNYDKTPLTSDEIAQIKGLINKTNEKSGLSIEFLEDGGEAISSPFFSNVRSLILLKGNKDDKDLKEKAGYYGEALVLDLTEKGLGTCWVTGSYKKDLITAGERQEIVAVITVGKIKGNFRDKFIRSLIGGKRREVKEERLLTQSLIPDWLEAGIEAVIVAPSAHNSQKVTFHYDGKVLTVDVPGDATTDLIDLGIAKRHFVEEAGGRFPVGNNVAFIS